MITFANRFGHAFVLIKKKIDISWKKNTLEKYFVKVCPNTYSWVCLPTY
jgi:hypothetical protein